MKKWNIIKNSLSLWFSKNNTINNIININSEDYAFDEFVLLLKEKWENCTFLEVTEILKGIKAKQKNEDSIIKYLLFEANLYLSIEEFGKAKDIIELLEQKYSVKVKNEIDYYKLKYLLFHKEDIKKILEIQFSLSVSELEWEVLYFNKKYDEFFLKSKELNLIKDIKYMILKLEKTSSFEEIKIILECIKKEIMLKSTLEKIIILEKIIDFLTSNMSLSTRIKFNEYLLLYIEIFEKNIQVKNFIKNDFEKKIINTYLNAKGRLVNKIKFLSLLTEYKNYLNDTNKIRLLIVENIGYKTLVESLYKSKNLEGLNMVLFILFLEEKYKYVLHLSRKFDFSISIDLQLIKVYSKIMLKKKINIEDTLYLEENHTKNDAVSLYYNIFLFQNEKINIDDFKKIIEDILEKNINNEILNLIILRAAYLIDWFWIINIFIKEQKKYEYLIPEIIWLISYNKIDGYNYNRIIKELDENDGTHDYELIGNAYIEYKNFNTGLEYLYKSWKQKKTLILAKKIRAVLIMKEVGDQEIYEYLKDCEKNNLEDKIKNIILLYFVDNKRGTVELNNLLLSFQTEDFNEVLNYIQNLYFNFLLRESKKETEFYFENSLYIEKSIRYIPNIYLKYNKEEYELMNKEDFDVYKLGNIKNLKNLKLALLATIMKKLNGFEKKASGIRTINIDKLKNNPEKIIEKLGELSGASKFQREREMYLNLNSKEYLLLLYNNFYELEDFISKFINRFNNNYLNMPKYTVNYQKNKLIAPDSILLLYKLKLLKILYYENSLFFQKTTYNFFKNEMHTYPEAKEIVKILKEFQGKMIDDENINELIRVSKVDNDIISPFSRLHYSFIEKNADYITEDRNLKFPGDINIYSSLFLISNNLRNELDYTEFNTLIQKMYY